MSELVRVRLGLLAVDAPLVTVLDDTVLDELDTVLDTVLLIIVGSFARVLTEKAIRPPISSPTISHASCVNAFTRGVP